MITAHTQPWLITPEAYCELATVLHRVEAGPFALPGKEPETTPAPENGLLTLPMHGTVLRQVPERTKNILAAYDVEVTDATALARDLLAARDNPEVRCVLLDIDSPGGTVNGTPELAAAVRSLSREKFVYAYTAGMACSAAYWVASQCNGIYAAPSARVGSIGVILPITDSSGLYEKFGLKVDVFAAGRYKSVGLDGTSLTDEQRDLLQQQVESTWADFKAAVNRRRTVDASLMEGQTFTGKQARENGLVDACSNSLASVQYKQTMRHGL